MVRNNRGRKPEKVADRSPRVTRNKDGAEADPPGSAVSRSPQAVPGQQPVPVHTGMSQPDTPTQPEAAPQSWREFAWRLFKDKEAQAGFNQMVRAVSLWIIFPLIAGIDAFIYLMMPTTSPTTKLVLTSAVTGSGIVVTLWRKLRKRLVVVADG